MIARIKALVIPPAWQDVWISPDPQGHIQAIGTDAAGRRQYRYHDDWRTARDAIKYDRVLTLGATLGDVRDGDRPAARRAGPRPRPGARRRACGCSTSGCSAPAASSTRPATTTRTARSASPPCAASTSASSAARSCSPTRPRATSRAALALRDPLLHRVVGSLLRRKGGGEELLAYKVRRDWCDVKTADLNGAVKELAGEEYTCKDLRTWNATVLAAVALAAGAAEKRRAG